MLVGPTLHNHRRLAGMIPLGFDHRRCGSMQQLIPQWSYVAFGKSEQSTQPRKAVRLAIAARPPPGIDSLVEPFVNLRFYRHNPKATRQAEHGKHIALRMRRTAIAQVRTTLGEGIKQFCVLPLIRLIEHRPDRRRQIIGGPPLVDQAFRGTPVFPMMWGTKMRNNFFRCIQGNMNTPDRCHAADSLNTPASSA